MNTAKKAVRLALAGLGLTVLGAFHSAYAAQNAKDINVTVTVDKVSVAVSSTSWDIGQITPGSTNLSGAIGVTNDGNRQEDYALDLTYTPGWAISADQTAGTDEFVMLGLFSTTPAASLVDADFGEGGAADDLIVDAPANASATKYARTDEGTPAKGFDVSASGLRSLMLDFRAPTANTINAQQSMTVTVTASAG